MKRRLFSALFIVSFLTCSCSNNNEPVKPTPEEKTITLFNETSKYYMRTLQNKDTISPLRTFHHKNYDDVPYVDMNEYHYAVRPYIERVRKFYQGENENTYIYSRVEDTGKMVFDTEKNTVTIHNALAFYYDAIGTNNDIKLYKESDKTKLLEEGKDVVIDLNEYNMDIVSQDNHLYVPINLVNTLIMAPVNAGVCFNGIDYFSDAAMRNKYTATFARSGNYNSSWMLTISEAPTALKRVDKKLSDEVYRFEGVYSGSSKEISVSEISVISFSFRRFSCR